MEILNNISESLQKGDSEGVKAYVQEAIDSGKPVEEILEDGLLVGMDIIGKKFKNNEVFVPEVLIAARAMNEGAALLKPLLKGSNLETKGRVCIGTIQGDLHDIGKNLVKMMMEGKGLEVIDLGIDVDPETFIKTAIDKECDIIACSALLTTTMVNIQKVVNQINEQGLSEKVKLMIGGAPVTQDLCDSIGADFYTSDASTAAEVALDICTQKRA